MKRDLQRKWDDLSPTTRRAVTVLALADTALKAVALFDLARRPAKEIKGSKRLWAAALTMINSVGLLPIGYLIFGRKR